MICFVLSLCVILRAVPTPCDAINTNLLVCLTWLQRQSRFDQPPGFQNQLGNIGGNGHAGPMGRSHMSSDHRMEQRLEEIESRGMESRSMESRSMESRSMEQHIMDPIEQRNLEQRAMEQRARAERPVRGGGDDFYENKRARRY